MPEWDSHRSLTRSKIGDLCYILTRSRPQHLKYVRTIWGILGVMVLIPTSGSWPISGHLADAVKCTTCEFALYYMPQHVNTELQVGYYQQPELDHCL